MSKKAFRINCRVQYADLEMTIMAEDEDDARQRAYDAIEGGEAKIEWGDEGDGVVRLDSITNVHVTKEE